MDPSVPSSESASSPEHVPWPDRQLPPVKPPSAAFLMQLFFIPLIIVTIIVMVWLMFSWLAHLGTKPEQLAADVEKLNQGSWQKALTLSNLLRDPRNAELRSDQALAERLGSVLQRQLEQGGTGSEQIMLRIWLSRALGEFDIDAGIPALVEAVTKEDSREEVKVRRAALQAIGILADRLPSETMVRQDGLLAALNQAATDRSDDPAEEEVRGQLRATAAYTLGLVGGDQAVDQLAAMLSDPFPDARYNAATGLARHGDRRAIPRLLEMLDPDNQDAIRFEIDSPSARKWKQRLVIKNALRSVRQLVQTDPGAPRDELEQAVRQLRDTELGKDGELRVEIEETLRTLKAEEVEVASARGE